MIDPRYQTEVKREPKSKVLTLSDETGETKKALIFYSIVEDNYIEVDDDKTMAARFKDYKMEIKGQLTEIHGKMREINFI